jgi:phosphonate transport system permease protein
MMLRLQDINASTLAQAQQVAPVVFAPRRLQALLRALGWLGFLLLNGYCLWLFDMSPLRFVNGVEALGRIVVQMFPPTAGDMLGIYLMSMLQTLGMAFLGTTLAAVLAFPLGLLAAKNMLPHGPSHFLFRRSCDVLRGVDQLIWALIFVRAVGLGPLAGILAIILSDTGTLAKLYSEAIENIDKKPVEGVRSVGGGPIQAIRWGVLPQVLPVMLSNVLYTFESNTRSATILGIVGAGGIGFYLSDRVRTMNWEDASFILLLILLTVYVIDRLSGWVRRRLIKG